MLKSAFLIQAALVGSFSQAAPAIGAFQQHVESFKSDLMANSIDWTAPADMYDVCGTYALEEFGGQECVEYGPFFYYFDMMFYPSGNNPRVMKWAQLYVEGTGSCDDDWDGKITMASIEEGHAKAQIGDPRGNIMMRQTMKVQHYGEKDTLHSFKGECPCGFITPGENTFTVGKQCMANKKSKQGEMCDSDLMRGLGSKFMYALNFENNTLSFSESWAKGRENRQMTSEDVEGLETDFALIKVEGCE